MHTKILNVLKITTLAVFLSLGLTYVYAWVGPTAVPPGNNTAAPINTSAITQAKGGYLNLSNIGVAGAAANAFYGLTVNSGSMTAISAFGTGGMAIYGNSVSGTNGKGVVGTGGNTGVSGDGIQVGVDGYAPGADNGFTGSIGVRGTADGTGSIGVVGNGGTADFWAQSKGIKFPNGIIQTSAMNFPDYTNGIAVTPSVNYVAPADGYFTYAGATAVKVNGVLLAKGQWGINTDIPASGVLPVKGGSTILASSPDGVPTLYFYPVK